MICDNGIMKRVLIGDWIDQFMDSDIGKLKMEKTPYMNLEYLKLQQSVTIPTCDENGNSTWATVTAVTRHDPSQNLYKITTLGGRSVIVAESKSLIVWNEDHGLFEPRDMLAVTTGDCVPTVCNLLTNPQIGYIDVSTYLPKTRFIYGSEFLKAKDLISPFIEPGRRVPNRWWSDNNGSSFMLPYQNNTQMNRALSRSKICQIKRGFVYSYDLKNLSQTIPDTFALNEENGFVIGVCLANGYIGHQRYYISIASTESNIQNSVKSWLYQHDIEYTHFKKQKSCFDPHPQIRAYSDILAELLYRWIGERCNRIPAETLFAPFEFRRGLINGYFSENGCIGKNCIECSSFSQELIEGISHICASMGIFCEYSREILQINNCERKNIFPEHRLFIRSHWAHKFANTIHLTHEEKNEKLKKLEYTEIHKNFLVKNDTVLDQIIDIEILSSDEYPKLYDVTVPATLNFGLANGLIVRDTAEVSI